MVGFHPPARRGLPSTRGRPEIAAAPSRPPGSGAWRRRRELRRRTARPVQLDLFETLPETALSGAQLPHVLRARAGVPGVPSTPARQNARLTGGQQIGEPEKVKKRRFEIDAASPPNLPGMMLSVIEALKDLGGSATIQELDERAIELEGVTEAEQTFTMPRNENLPRVNYYLAWARTYLKPRQCASELFAWGLGPDRNWRGDHGARRNPCDL